MNYEVYLALGTNVGDREGYLKEAVGRIASISCTELVCVSSIYETAPVGYTDQADFLNMAVSLTTCLEPSDFLRETQQVENMLKRVREIHWGPRTIDIDILLYGDMKVKLPDLDIPHPRMYERAFVLVPLKEVYPYKRISGSDFDCLIAACSDKSGIKLYKKASLKDFIGE